MNILIERNGDSYVTSYDVWAKQDAYPQGDGDGVYVGNYPIGPDEDAVSEEWTPPNDGAWYIGALSIYRREPGLFFQLNGT